MIGNFENSPNFPFSSNSKQVHHIMTQATKRNAQDSTSGRHGQVSGRHVKNELIKSDLIATSC